MLLYTTLKGIIIFKAADTFVCSVSLDGAYFLDVLVIFVEQVGRKALRHSEYQESALALPPERASVAC